ncbi:sialate O-acetylesterase [Arenibacter nanhaiticus]|uniref:Sialate O-acetylesterase n=1 Tax=Arenibacter nanhaiticus TaxID=558155 RepID=A0A1M6ITI6_9FLAO|nr:sialate O-acetylesterase [Arenibacter nanhaiticus]SHJ37738.1 sialate O-acetylesterase [Arenibacter nanhaiticus]
MNRILVLLLLLSVSNSYGEIWLPSILSDNMVLQQQSKVTIWGWTTATSEEITVYGSWNNEKITTKAYQGVWSLQLPTPKAGGTYSLHIEGHEKLEINNVLIGEVWLGSGQSNMQWTPNQGLENAEEEINNANYPEMRFFQVAQQIAACPQEQLKGKWVVCSPETMKEFSSVAYFFGRELHQKLSVPVGLITSSWGGTPVEVWLQEALITENAELSEAAEKLAEVAWWPNTPGIAYNAMIHPITKFNIAGFIWYQGESNRQNPSSYYKSFPLLIKSWRAVWGKELPFYFVQIAPFKYDDPDGTDAAQVRDAQLYTMKNVDNTGMVVTNDIGNLENIHPINKQDVGYRLALWALANTYEKGDLTFSGPLYQSMEKEAGKIILHFDHTVKGLKKKGKVLSEFYIAGEDRKFYPAKAKIKGSTVLVASPKVKDPVAVRFAFTNGATPNLYNAAGLPASAFRTDDWELSLNK